MLLSLLLSTACSQGKQDWPQVLPVVDTIVSAAGLHKPIHILRFKNHYVTTELDEDKLAIFDSLDLSRVSYFDPVTIHRHFKAPHFMAISPRGHLLITNGWGDSIVKIEDIDGSGWQEFGGLPGSEFNAPHGICVDDDGWIYVGDSRNSRIVRFKDMKGSSWQVFKDVDRVIAYARQVICKNGSVWVANTYESIEGLNPGRGANVLRIDDFNSGKVHIIHTEKKTPITGILPLKDSLLVARWGRKKNIAAIDFKTGKLFPIKKSHNRLGVPYGIFKDRGNRIITAYFGSLKTNFGGLVTLTVNQ
ncbi:MAG: hypothetical protein DSY89_07825 [Deltaproteobacteria bacterium]|nr:MAG: hypothetical protein DSY89_07825 [Deltaproteobacteria bacterium]